MSAHPIERAPAGLFSSRNLPRTMQLADGTTGYLVLAPRTDTCWQAALATCLQVPIAQCPDPHHDERVAAGEDPEDVDEDGWRMTEDWLDDRGLKLVEHRTLPARRRRWIGVISAWQHCLVMAGPNVLFDPTFDYTLAALSKLVSPRQLAAAIRTRTFGGRDLDLGYSFDRKR
jgi:hypothetical protein